MARSGSHLQDGSRATRIMPRYRGWLFPSTRKGAAIFTDTELAGSVDCDLRGRRTAPEIVTSSGSSFDGPGTWSGVECERDSGGGSVRSGDSVRLS